MRNLLLLLLLLFNVRIEYVIIFTLYLFIRSYDRLLARHSRLSVRSYVCDAVHCG